VDHRRPAVPARAPVLALGLAPDPVLAPEAALLEALVPALDRLGRPRLEALILAPARRIPAPREALDQAPMDRDRAPVAPPTATTPHQDQDLLMALARALTLRDRVLGLLRVDLVTRARRLLNRLAPARALVPALVRTPVTRNRDRHALVLLVQKNHRRNRPRTRAPTNYHCDCRVGSLVSEAGVITSS